jgi:hypothetical protein
MTVRTPRSDETVQEYIARGYLAVTSGGTNCFKYGGLIALIIPRAELARRFQLRKAIRSPCQMIKSLR